MSKLFMVKKHYLCVCFLAKAPQRKGIAGCFIGASERFIGSVC